MRVVAVDAAFAADASVYAGARYQVAAFATSRTDYNEAAVFVGITYTFQLTPCTKPSTG